MRSPSAHRRGWPPSRRSRRRRGRTAGRRTRRTRSCLRSVKQAARWAPHSSDRGKFAMRSRSMHSGRSTAEARRAWRRCDPNSSNLPSIMLAHENQPSGCAEFHGPIPHGDFCSCTILADAVGADRSAIPFEFCRRVLQKRWRMTCRHGLTRAELEEGKRAAPALGRLDATQAILVNAL